MFRDQLPRQSPANADVAEVVDDGAEDVPAKRSGCGGHGRTDVVVTHEHDIAAHAGRQVRFLDGLVVSDITTPKSERHPC